MFTETKFIRDLDMALRYAAIEHGQHFSAMMYHGSRSHLSEGDTLHPGGDPRRRIDAGNMGEAVYLTPHRHVARYYANHDDRNVHQVSVYLKRPLILEGDKNEAAQKAAAGLGVIEVPEYDGTQQKNLKWSQEFASRAKEAGYDGAIWIKDGKAEEVASYHPVSIGVD
jgi:ADP-Ribosyltransferase in polyvalent proteins